MRDIDEIVIEAEILTEWTCDGAPSWIPVPEKDNDKTEEEIIRQYTAEGFSAVRVRKCLK